MPNSRLNSATSAVSMVRIVSIACVRRLACDGGAYLLDVLPGRIDFLGERLQVRGLRAECRHDDSMSAEPIFSGKLVIAVCSQDRRVRSL
jgi:hypothetical protein